jgi:hypothetical protein
MLCSARRNPNRPVDGPAAIERTSAEALADDEVAEDARAGHALGRARDE